MTEIDQKISALSPKKRALLEARLLKKTVPPETAQDVADQQTSNPELSFAQQSLWFLNRLQPKSSFYNIPNALRITGPLNYEALEKSFEGIINRHEVLRTQIVALDGQPVPRLASNSSFVLPIIDLMGLPEYVQQSKISKLMEEEAKRPFNLERDLMIRASILHLGVGQNIVLLTVHHIAADLWSFSVLYRELAELYGALVEGRSPHLPPLTTSYSDFALREREFLASNKLELQSNYWRQQLKGELPEMDLPTDHPRPKMQKFRGAREYIAISASVSDRLKLLAQRENTTLFVTLLAAFQTLLHRHSDQTDIIVGSPLGARTRVETEKLIGYFLNTIPLRTDLSGDPTFRDLLKRTREVVLGGFANQDIPFEKLVDELRIPRLMDRNPIFQTMFQYQATAAPTLQLPGTVSEPLLIETGTSKLDLVFTLAESANGISGDLEYNTDLFDDATIERLLGHYTQLLEAIVANPFQKISRLKLLSDTERAQLLDWNKTQTGYPREKTIAQLFQEQAERTPENVALVFGSEQMTYRQLDESANQLAQHLHEVGVGPDSLVGIALDRSFDLIIGLLAILKAGGAYVPLDSNLPEDRLRFMIEDTGVSILITDKQFAFSAIRKINPRTLPQILDVQRSFLDIQCSPENLAYVTYTSGSTGKPKGVAVPQRAVVRLVKQTNYMRFGSDEVFLQFAPVSFDASTLEIWGALLNGAKLVIFPPQLPSLEELGATLCEHHVTTLWLTAGLFHQMVEHRLDDLRGIKQLLAGGDVLSVPHVNRVLEQFPNCQLINGYGPTENTTFTCCYSIPRHWNGRSVPIGEPISNTQVYVLDKNLEPVPIGVPGELHIGGDGLARGYLNRPELNTQKFISNPFYPDARLYKTGDKVRWLADGTIEFLGRIDHQVKVRGFRIELEEIEAALAQHPLIRQTVVVARSVGTTDKELIAYFTTENRIGLSISELRAHLGIILPSYMIPTHFVPLDELPLTANGKIDRRKLPAPEEIASTPDAGQVAPRNDVETKLLEIWRELLGRNHFGVRENFFELGGHSLLATRVVSRVAQKFQIDFSLQKIFEFPTIEGLARAVSDSSREVKRPTLARRTRAAQSAPVTSQTNYQPTDHELIDVRG